jgi:hypothetical protein
VGEQERERERERKRRRKAEVTKPDDRVGVDPTI